MGAAVRLPPDHDVDIAPVLAAWHARGKRSVNELFESDPAALAATLCLDLEALSPMLRLRPQLTSAHRLVERLARDGVELVTVWERRFPQQLKQLLGESTPRALWHLGPLSLLDAAPVALIGSRLAPAEALDFAKQLGAGLARAQCPILTGVARAVERAGLEAALHVEGGSAVVVLGQGIATAMPELRRWQPVVRAGRMLVLGLLHPEAAWEPWLESLRGLIAIGLTEKIVVAHAASGDDTSETARQALRFEHEVFIRGGVDADLELGGAIALPGGAMAASTVLGTQPMLAPVAADTGAGGVEPNMVTADVPPVGQGPSQTNGRAEPANAISSSPAPLDADEATPVPEHGIVPAATSRKRARAAERGGAIAAGSSTAEIAPGVRTIEEKVVETLGARRGPTGKGALVQALGVEEGTLDRALLALIGARKVVQRPLRGGVGYTLLADDEHTGPGMFQPSLFNQD